MKPENMYSKEVGDMIEANVDERKRKRKIKYYSI